MSYVTHGRVGGTHGGVLNVHTGPSRANCLSLLISLALSTRLSFSLFLLSALSVLNDDDKKHSVQLGLSVHTALTSPEG